MPEVKIFGVAGNPVLHSRSPELFRAAYPDSSHIYLRVAAANRDDLLTIAEETGIAALNITAPFKEDIAQIKNIDLSPESRTTGAVNSLKLNLPEMEGHNTDCFGVVESLEKAELSLTNLKVAVLGAGGAARSAVYGLTKQGAHVTVINRTVSKAVKLAKDLKCSFSPTTSASEIVKNCGFIISTLPAETVPDYIKESITELTSRRTPFFDAVYNRKSAIAEILEKAGGVTISGLNWLLNQGIESYRFFTGVEPDINSMKQILISPFQQMPERIALTGFMGAGKTTIGKLLAHKKEWDFIDIDEEIEKRTQLSIKEIFNQKGETFFRNLESETFRELSSRKQIVVSCGGGVINREENRRLLKEEFINVWIYTSLPLTFSRGIGNSRPLLSCPSPELEAARLLKERIPLYADAADLLISGNRNPREIVERIDEETDRVI